MWVSCVAVAQQQLFSQMHPALWIQGLDFIDIATPCDYQYYQNQRAAQHSLRHGYMLEQSARRPLGRLLVDIALGDTMDRTLEFDHVEARISQTTLLVSFLADCRPCISFHRSLTQIIRLSYGCSSCLPFSFWLPESLFTYTPSIACKSPMASPFSPLPF